MRHDLDRTLDELELEGEWETYADDDEHSPEDWEEESFDVMDRDGEFESAAHAEPVPYSPLTEDEEMEFAAELLNVSSDEELDQFLGRIVRRAARGVRNIARRGQRLVKGAAGRKLVGIARGVARKALPAIGRAAGAAFGGPAGAVIGARVAAGAGRTFGLELEGLSPEDQEFEAARRVVRFAAAATDAAVANAAKGEPQDHALRRGIVDAAKRHAPGLLRGGASPRGGHNGQSGRWVRRGNRIVLEGI